MTLAATLHTDDTKVMDRTDQYVVPLSPQPARRRVPASPRARRCAETAWWATGAAAAACYGLVLWRCRDVWPVLRALGPGWLP